MNFFTDGKFSWWQIGLLKVSVVLIGIAIGSTWPQLFASNALIFAMVGIVIGIYLWAVWIKSMKK